MDLGKGKKSMNENYFNRYCHMFDHHIAWSFLPSIKTLIIDAASGKGFILIPLQTVRFCCEYSWGSFNDMLHIPPSSLFPFYCVLCIFFSGMAHYNVIKRSVSGRNLERETVKTLFYMCTHNFRVVVELCRHVSTLSAALYL